MHCDGGEEGGWRWGDGGYRVVMWMYEHKMPRAVVVPVVNTLWATPGLNITSVDHRTSHEVKSTWRKRFTRAEFGNSKWRTTSKIIKTETQTSPDRKVIRKDFTYDPDTRWSRRTPGLHHVLSNQFGFPATSTDKEQEVKAEHRLHTVIS